METEVKLTKLAQCAGCGAKVGAGTLAKLLDGIPTRSDERLLVGFDKSDDASVYKIDENTALVQTLDFFPPIVDDPEMFGEIAAVNAISDIYAMGADPKLALNIMCVTKDMPKESIQAILRGGYKKAYEAGVIITGGHTIHDQEPKYGLSVSGFVHPQKFLTNSGARPGDILILTKPLGVGILTTSAKAEFIDQKVMDKIYDQMRQLNKYARDIMVKYEVHSCTDVTGFGLLGHGYEMAQGSDVTIHFMTEEIPYHKEALSMADLGMIPEGAYRNRKYASEGVSKTKKINRALEDILYDPQTSGGLMIAVSENDAKNLLEDLQNTIPCAKIIGYIEEKEEKSIMTSASTSQALISCLILYRRYSWLRITIGERDERSISKNH